MRHRPKQLTLSRHLIKDVSTIADNTYILVSKFYYMSICSLELKRNQARPTCMIFNRTNEF